MVIPVFISVRGIFFVSIIIIGFGIFGIMNNSKEKSEYEKTTGVIEYFGKELGNLPFRDKGKSRYIQLDNYPYPFEIYDANREPTQNRLDDLKLGDTIDVYYYETSNTTEEGLNRYAQFVDKKQTPYFIRNGFQKNLGYVIVCLGLLLNLMSLIFWKMGKLNW